MVARDAGRTGSLREKALAPTATCHRVPVQAAIPENFVVATFANPPGALFRIAVEVRDSDLSPNDWKSTWNACSKTRMSCCWNGAGREPNQRDDCARATSTGVAR